MQVVSERTEAEIRAHQALAKVKGPMRRLAANLLRVVRGAGSSAELGQQMVACIIAMDAYRDAVGHGVPSWDLNEMLDPQVAYSEARPWVKSNDEDLARWEEDGTADAQAAEMDIQKACLQMVASTLVDQLTQKRRGEHDLYEGIRRLEAARERSRAYHRAKYAPPPAPRTRRKPKAQ